MSEITPSGARLVLFSRAVGEERAEPSVDDPIPWLEAIARKVARRTGTWVDVDELVGLGAQGLVDAARRFDANRGVPFAAYARPRVQGAMLDGLRALGTTPSAVLRASAATGAAERYSARFASAQAAGLLAETTGQRDGPVPLAPADETPEAVALRRELHRLLTEAVGGLAPVEQALVVRCGLGDEPLEQVAAALHLSAERGRQVYRRALLRLRAPLRAAL